MAHLTRQHLTAGRRVRFAETLRNRRVHLPRPRAPLRAASHLLHGSDHFQDIDADWTGVNTSSTTNAAQGAKVIWVVTELAVETVAQARELGWPRVLPACYAPIGGYRTRIPRAQPFNNSQPRLPRDHLIAHIKAAAGRVARVSRCRRKSGRSP